MSKPFGYWTKERCIEDAKNFNTRIEWKLKSSSSYSSTLRNKWLDECTKHMIKLGSQYKRLIYSFEFEDKSVYVGLTYNSKERQLEHLNPKRIKKSAVYRYINTTGLKPNYKELTDYIDRDIASIKEGEFVKQYKQEGWKILNKNKTGALGGNNLKWTKEKCLEEALNYKTIKEWKNKSGSSYVASSKNKWLDECTQHMIFFYKRWTKEKCIEDAKKYHRVTEWRKNSGGAYRLAYNKKFLSECCFHMK